MGRSPGAELLVCQVVFLRNGVRADDYLKAEFRTDEVAEGFDARARRVADDEPGGKMDDLSTVSFHLCRRVFYISARAAVTTGVADQLDVFALIDAERTLATLHRAKAFSAGTRAIAIADDDSNSYGIGHAEYSRYSQLGIQYISGNLEIYRPCQSVGRWFTPIVLTPTL